MPEVACLMLTSFGASHGPLARLPGQARPVKNYVSVLFAKLGMERRTQAAAYAARLSGDSAAR